MDEPRWLDEEQMAAWRPFSAVVELLPGALDAPLREYGLTYFEYLVLAMLSDAPRHTLRMSYLSALTQGSLSRLSHVAARLEARGWISRSPSPDDRRATLATLTPAGYDHLVATAPAHVESVQSLVFDVLSREQVRQLRDIAEVLMRHLRPGATFPWEATERTER